jgi:outer membrane receptor for ferric coprogen and ferric-rhodotorulic acid
MYHHSNDKIRLSPKLTAFAFVFFSVFLHSVATAQRVAEKPAEDTGSEVVQLERYTVQADSAVSYQTQSAFSATRLDISLLETPQSVISVDRQLLDDQAASGIADALRNVAGVVRVSSFWGSQSNTVSTRGFALNDERSYFRDGFRYLGKSVAETQHLDRVEVLRGPASVLYGRNEPGGIVVELRPATGEIVHVHDSRTAGVGEWIETNTFGLHIGTWAGLPGRLAYLLLGLSPALLAVTGWRLWRRRRLGARLAVRRKAAAAPMLG